MNSCVFVVEHNSWVCDALSPPAKLQALQVREKTGRRSGTQVSSREVRVLGKSAQAAPVGSKPPALALAAGRMQKLQNDSTNATARK